jgi:hypothetical protein
MSRAGVLAAKSAAECSEIKTRERERRQLR